MTEDGADDVAARYAGYAGAQLRVEVDGRTLTLRPRPRGHVTGDFPFGAGPVHVVTASDPGAARLPARENAARHEELVRELDALGVPRREAVAGAPDGSHEEVGVLVEGLADGEARRIGARWGQDAVFRWSRDAWTVLPCDDRTAPRHLGWETDIAGEARSGPG